MPELPEVERVRRSLSTHILNARVLHCELLRPDVCTPFDGAGGTSATELLEGGVIRELRRHGKQIAIIAGDGRTLVVHLGMSGQVLAGTAARARPHDPGFARHIHARWILVRDEERLEMVFRDPRRFGGLWTFPSFQQAHAALWSQLGPDAMLVDAGVLAPALRSTARSVKSVLLDQSVIAGVGNIYADESLFRAGVRPTRRGRTITRTEVERLATAIKYVLDVAVDAGGSTLRSYADADGVAGSAQLTHAAYGRGGKPCIRCGATLRRKSVGQRTTVWCPTCQH